jgi:hypothetical protein
MNEGFNIASINSGALVEQVDAEIQKVLLDIADPNKEPEKKRKIVVTLIFEGTEDRDTANVKYDTKSMVPPARTQTTRIAFEKTGNGVVAEELKRGALRGQTQIDPDTGEIIEPKTKSRVVTMR